MDKVQDSIIIKKIVLHNFKQFFGEHELVFGYTPKKFINIVQGPGGSGKTSLFDAILWCLSSENFATFENTDNLLNIFAGINLKNSQKMNVTVQIFFSVFNTKQKIMIKRDAVFTKSGKGLRLKSESFDAMELKKNIWNPCEYNVVLQKFFPKMAIPSFLWGHEKENFHQFLATGDRIILFFEFLASLRKTSKFNLPLIIDSPFSRLEIEKRVFIANSFKKNFNNCQIILLGTRSEFEDLDIILNPLTNKKYTIVPRADDPRNSVFAF